MKYRLTYQSILLCFIISLIVMVSGCGGLKDAQERRNLMIPRKDELPRNKKYKMAKQRKTYKYKKRHKKAKKFK